MLTAPLDVALTDDTVLQRDVLVAQRCAFNERDLPTAPLLAIEVLSLSTRRVDLLLTHDRYRAAGCPAYWVVDPDEPNVVAWELADDAYVEVGRARAGEELRLERPFPIRFRPDQLIA